MQLIMRGAFVSCNGGLARLCIAPKVPRECLEVGRDLDRFGSKVMNGIMQTRHGRARVSNANSSPRPLNQSPEIPVAAHSHGSRVMTGRVHGRPERDPPGFDSEVTLRAIVFSALE